MYEMPTKSKQIWEGRGTELFFCFKALIVFCEERKHNEKTNNQMVLCDMDQVNDPLENQGL